MGHLATVDVVGYEVALRVIHLYLVAVGGVEVLVGLVGGIDYQLEPRMPGGINAGREDRVTLHTDLLQLAIVGDDGAAVVLAGMELQAPGVVLLVVVAVDALPGLLCRAEHIVIDDALVVVLQAALADGQFLIADEGGVDEAVAQIAVDAVGRHIDTEGPVVGPLSCLAGIDVHGDGIALGPLCQLAPVAEARLRLP